MEFRTSKFGDLPAIVEIYNSSIESTVSTADITPVTVDQKEDWFIKRDFSQRPIWVAEQNNEILGWASFQSFYGRPAYQKTVEVSVYVSPRHKKKGVGSFILSSVIKNSGTAGVQTLLAFIFKENKPSLILFKKYGFKDWGYLPGIAEIKGESRDLIILGLKLD